MQSTCLTNEQRRKDRRAARREEATRHRERLLLHRIQKNRKTYPELYKIIDSKPFQHWYIICTGKPWPTTLEADVENLALKLNAMQLVYGSIPDE